MRWLLHPYSKFALMCLLILTLPNAICAPSSSITLPETLSSPTEDIHQNKDNKTPEYVVIKPSEQVTYSSETVASIAEILVREGSKFKKDDVLIRLDCRIQAAELEKTRAQAKSTSLGEISAQRLKSYGSISELELTKAESEAAIARAEVNKLQAIVDKCVVRAPFNGAVAKLYVHALESVKPGDPMIKIMNTEKLEFEVQVPSNWLRWLRIGTGFDVRLNETNKIAKAKVIRIDPEVESVSQTIKITGEIDEPDPFLLPGMSGQAHFNENPDN